MSAGGHYSVLGARCPHCRHLNDPKNDSALLDTTSSVVECEHCRKAFGVSVKVEYSWTTSPLDDNPWKMHAEGND